jgi:pimeloyl-[acyl-carrier protein] methyl ester esterase
LFKREPSEMAVKLFLAGWDAPKHLTTAVREAVRTVPPAVLAGRLKQVLSCDVRAQLSNIYRPILCIRAKRDRLVRPASTQEILRASRVARLAEIDGPHLILQRQPRRCEQAIADFIHDL